MSTILKYLTFFVSICASSIVIAEDTNNAYRVAFKDCEKYAYEETRLCKLLKEEDKGSLESLLTELKSIVPPDSSDFEKNRAYKKAKNNFTIEFLRTYYVDLRKQYRKMEKGVFGSICVYDDYDEIDCDSRKFSYENAVRLRSTLLGFLETRISEVNTTEKYRDKHLFWTQFHVEWAFGDSMHRADSMDNTRHCEFKEVYPYKECSSEIYDPYDYLKNENQRVMKFYERSFDEEKLNLETGSLSYQQSLVESLDYHDEVFEGLLSEMILFSGWNVPLPNFDDPDFNSRVMDLGSFVKSEDSENRRQWLCDSVFDETATQQRELLGNAFPNELDFCDSRSFWQEIVRSKSLEPTTLKDFRFSDRWIPETFLRLRTLPLDNITERLNDFEFNSEYDDFRFLGLVYAMLEHVQLSVLFSAQTGDFYHSATYVGWRQRMREIGRNYFYNGISNEKDVEERASLLDESFESYQFLSYLGAPQTDRERAIFKVYEGLFNTGGKLSDLREKRRLTDQREEYQQAFLVFKTVESCFLSRREYLAQYVTNEQFNNAKGKWDEQKKSFDLSDDEKQQIELELMQNEGYRTYITLNSLGQYNEQQAKECQVALLGITLSGSDL